MLDEAVRSAPFEACGVLTVTAGGAWSRFLALPNRAVSATRFVIDPGDLFAAITQAEMAGESVLGFFHSHPRGPATPSQVDVAEWPDAQWTGFLAGRVGSGWELRAFRLDGDRNLVEVAPSGQSAAR
jgi:proteasome lid subunit RPN8/RPN11